MKLLRPGLKKPFSFFVSFTCIAFVGWQSIKCIMKFLNLPTGTSVSIKYIDRISYEQFPAITICPREAEGFNEERLKECNIQVNDEYK